MTTAAPGSLWRVLSQRDHDPLLPSGLDAVCDFAAGLVGRAAPRQKAFLRGARRVMAREKPFADMPDRELRDGAAKLHEIFRRGRDRRADLERAYALVREVAWRQIGERPFLVQVAGALALNAGTVVEMATGEGKTLTATMPAAIAGWRGRGCHVVTVNDYLAKRDAEWMGRIYRFCGLRVAHIEQGMSPEERRAAYGADVTYCTNKEVTADFLRDRLTLGKTGSLPLVLLRAIVGGRAGGERLVQRGLACAIVDEADSVLIDEAVTPLIISGDAPNPEQSEAYRQAAALAERLESPRDYTTAFRYREITLTRAGRERVAQWAAPLGGVWTAARRREELMTQALTARHFYRRDEQYVVKDRGVVIVDEFTGRLMPDRTWRHGMHQMIEAREGLDVQTPKDTYARISFQRFFRLYRRLCGMTGTASEAWRELWRIYHLPVTVIPTNRPCRRTLLPHRILPSADAKWRAVVDEVRAVHPGGRPVLIGTRSVAASECLSRMLEEGGLTHAVLNAARHAHEARIVAQAGERGKITVATNMAGRGTDIRLGEGVAARGGLHVIATERHEAARIDRQLFGRCARQGDPGTAQAIVSLDDELVHRYAPRRSSWLSRHARADRDVAGRLARHVFDAAQRSAENEAARRRRAVLRTDDWLDEALGFAGGES